jgi:hypothetical protein
MGLQSKTMKNQRVVRLTLVADVSANTFDVSAVDYARDGLAGDFVSVPFAMSAANPCDIELGEALPAGTIIRLTGTIQA